MQKFILLAVAIVAGYAYLGNPYTLIPDRLQYSTLSERQNDTDATLADAFSNRKRNLQVSGEGVVTKLLPDDNDGSRHQKFIIALRSGQTLLIAHNIDLALRISSLKKGDAIQFSGQYEWNEKGGVVHWTHHDPNGSHVAGWLKHNGQIYQ
ncbi:DUF3465 domain-containing protein [Nitrosomonas sp. HPC101]|uniref:DUF3465 domain-containing protein n=1 Tax=Nitrosomonas sp. HPC101 TaxID=1658667 RepID=UPI00136BCFFE|nr:DUF3465 domain-containing protein [Nitrosomonas sp. HPC101]MXS86042.1 DUF3465 domain-containing protein [Nitrosomonas sp. HPC101]